MRPSPPSVLAVFGPTASGKTAVAVALAGQVGGEIVSCDSMQMYEGLPVLTSQGPGRLAGVWPLEHEGSVGEYQRLAHAAIDEIVAAGKTPVVAGGTGLYLRAAVAELELPPAPEPGARERWERLYDRLGPERAHALLRERDRAAAGAVHPNDRRRIVRALELVELGASLHPPRDRLWADETRHPTLIAGLDVPLAELDRRIEERTLSMFERGVETEVRAALDHELSRTARQVLGLREVAELPRESAIAEIARKTRRYARYQRKWMRRIPGVVIVAADRSAEETADAILEVARARQRVPPRRGGFAAGRRDG